LKQAVPGVRSYVLVELEAQTLVVRFRKCRDIIGLVRIEKDIGIRRNFSMLFGLKLSSCGVEGAHKSLSNLNAETSSLSSEYFHRHFSLDYLSSQASIINPSIHHMKFIPPLALTVLPVTQRLSSEHKNLQLSQQ
jgi:hypothetical protein